MNPTKESVNNPSVDYNLEKYNTFEFFYANFPALNEIVDALDTEIKNEQKEFSDDSIRTKDICCYTFIAISFVFQILMLPFINQLI